MLKNQLFCKKLPKSLNIFDQSLNDINLHLHPKVIDKDLRTKIISRRDKVIGQAKLDMMAIYISTAEATARGHAKIAKEEFDKLLLLISNSYSSVPVPVATMMITAANTDEVMKNNNIINAIEARRENIIQRAEYVTAWKMSFFDETPAMLID